MSPAGAWTTGACELIVNGRVVRAAGVAPTTTLLEWLRSQGLTGTKRGCDEGDCGACTVALVDRDAQGRPTYRAFNSCIALLPMFAGREIVTVEALAEGAALHPVQDEMVRHYGSQCGYCTPGVIMTAKALLQRNASPTKDEIRQATAGNLCRCTGYQQIVEAIDDAARVLREEKA